MIGVEVKKHLQETVKQGGDGRSEDFQNCKIAGLNDKKESAELAADVVNVSARSIYKAEKLIDEAPYLAERVRAGQPASALPDYPLRCYRVCAGRVGARAGIHTREKAINIMIKTDINVLLMHPDAIALAHETCDILSAHYAIELNRTIDYINEAKQAKIPRIESKAVKEVSTYHKDHRSKQKEGSADYLHNTNNEEAKIYLAAEYWLNVSLCLFLQAFLIRGFGFDPELGMQEAIPDLPNGTPIESRLQFHYACVSWFTHKSIFLCYGTLLKRCSDANAHYLLEEGQAVEEKIEAAKVVLYHDFALALVRGDEASIINLSAFAFSRISLATAKSLRNALKTSYDNPVDGLLQALPSAVAAQRAELNLTKAAKFVTNVGSDIVEQFAVQNPAKTSSFDEQHNAGDSGFVEKFIKDEDAKFRLCNAGLTADEKRVIELFFQGHTETEIAHAVGRAVGTVRSWKARALNKLRETATL